MLSKNTVFQQNTDSAKKADDKKESDPEFSS